MRLDTIADKIHHLTFPSQYELASALLRFQEHYESPKFRNKIFSLEDYMDWYAKKHGTFSYYTDWSGFNFPSRVLRPFRDGRFDPLLHKEQAVLDAFKQITHPFYIIGTVDGDDPATLVHEIAHGLWATRPTYRRDARKALRGTNTTPIREFLAEHEYHPAVWEDETQAYILTDLDDLERDEGKDIKHLRSTAAALREIYDSHRHAAHSKPYKRL